MFDTEQNPKIGLGGGYNHGIYQGDNGPGDKRKTPLIGYWRPDTPTSTGLDTQSPFYRGGEIGLPPGDAGRFGPAVNLNNLSVQELYGSGLADPTNSPYKQGGSQLAQALMSMGERAGASGLYSRGGDVGLARESVAGFAPTVQRELQNQEPARRLALLSSLLRAYGLTGSMWDEMMRERTGYSNAQLQARSNRDDIWRQIPVLGGGIAAAHP